MTGRQSSAVAKAVMLVKSRGMSVAGAAKVADVAPSSVRRALRAAGEPPKPAGRPAKVA